MSEEERVPWWRYAFAGTLGLSLLGMTYVLFDPDLGTPVPLLQEFTCTGRIAVAAANGYGNATLRVPETGIYAKATRADDSPVDAYLVLHRREAGEKWRDALAAANPTGSYVFTLSDVAPSTEVYVEARSMDGQVCAGRSGILRASSPASAAP